MRLELLTSQNTDVWHIHGFGGSIKVIEFHKLMILFHSSTIGNTANKSGLNDSNIITSGWKLGSLAQDSDTEHSDEDDKFFDCQGWFINSNLLSHSNFLFTLK